MKKNKFKRKELIIIKHSAYDEIKQSLKNDNIGSVYIKTSEQTLSNTREQLITFGYTTRLFVEIIKNNDNQFYIYGKKKGNKGVFNEHCKNTVYEYQSENEFLNHIINVSSNEGDTVFTDDKDLLKNISNLKRIGLFIA